MLGGPIGTFIDIGMIVEVVPGFGIDRCLGYRKTTFTLNTEVFRKRCTSDNFDKGQRITLIDFPRVLVRPRRIFKGFTGLLCLARTPRPQISMGTPWVTLVLGQVTRSPKILPSKQYGRDSSLFFDMQML